MNRMQSREGCGAIVGIAAAMLLIAWGATDLRTWLASRNWPEVPAHIEEVQLVDAPSSERPRGVSFNGKVVRAQHSYSINGTRYHGSKINLGSASGILMNSWHRRKYEELAAFVDSQQPFHCFVNPRNPSEAILYRDNVIPPGSALAGAGIGIVAALYWRWMRRKNELLT